MRHLSHSSKSNQRPPVSLKRRPSIWSGVFGVMITVLLLGDAPAQTNPDLEIRVGFFIDPVDKVDRSDLKYTLDAWADNFATDRFPVIKVTMFENEPRFRQALAAGTLDVGAFYSYQFENIAETAKEPSFIIGRDAEPLVEFLLLVRRDAGIDTARDLKGKRILINTGRRGRLPLMWLRRYMLSEGVAESQDAFSEINYVGDSFKAIAPVFFKNASVCIITRKEFQENAQLNAQVVQDLHELANSMNMPTRVMLFSPLIDRAKRDSIELLAEKMEPAIYPQTFLDQVNETIIEYQKGDLAEVAKLAQEPQPKSKSGAGEAALSHTVDPPARDVGEQE